MEFSEKGYEFVEHELPFRYEEDGLHVTRGSAWTGPGCHEGCGVLMYTDDKGKLVKVEGDPENPFNQGRLCIRCLAAQDVVNSDKRLKHPMKRAKEDRGLDKFERITWDEAYDLIEERLNTIKEEYGAESVIFTQGTGRDIASWNTRLCWSFGSPNQIFHMSGLSCYAPRVSGCFATTGSFWVGDYSQPFANRYDDPHWKRPEVILIWGNNPVVSNSDGVFGHWIVDCMKRGSKIIVCDPRTTWLASKAAYHLPVRPGTDAALAMGILNVIISEDIYDHDFVDRWCYGFDELADTCKEYTPQRVAEICWIDAEDMRKAARMIANAENAILQWGVGFDMTREAIPASAAAFDIMSITGNIDKPGAMIAPTSILYYMGGWGYDELLSEEQKAKRLGLDKYALLRFGVMAGHTDTMIEAMETGKPYPIKAAWIETTNFLACTAPDPKRTLAAYQGLDFIVGVDLFMTPTLMALADVILPAATYPERSGIRVGDGCQRGEAIVKACDAGDCRSDQQISLEMGKRFNPEAWPWDSVEEMYSFILEDNGVGMDFAELEERSPVYLPFEYGRYEKGKLRADGKPGFNTHTGRIELWSTYFQKAGLSPLPYFEEPVPGPTSTPELLEEYPLVLTTGARQWASFHSEHRQIPSLRAVHPDPVLQINPKTAAKHGVRNGRWVWVENQRGRALRKIEITPTLPERIVSTDHAWWLPEAAPELEDGLYGLWDMAINQLIPWECGKSGFGCNYKTMLCKIYPAD